MIFWGVIVSQIYCILESRWRHGCDGGVSVTDFGQQLGVKGGPQAPNGGRGRLKHISIGLGSSWYGPNSYESPVGVLAREVDRISYTGQ